MRPKDPKLKQDFVDEYYPKVLALIKRGSTIEAACKTLKISRVILYYSITEDQNNELKEAKREVYENGRYGKASQYNPDELA